MNLIFLLILSLAPIPADSDSDTTTAIGAIIINHNVEEALLKVGDEVYEVVSGDTLFLPVGTSRGWLFKKGYNTHNMYINISDEHLSLHQAFLVRARTQEILKNTLFPRVYHNSNLFIQTEDDAEIVVNDSVLGIGNTMLNLPEGNHRVISRHKSGRTIRRNVQVSDIRMANVEMFHRPRKEDITFQFLIPGRAQGLKNERFKRNAIIGGMAGLVAFTGYTTAIHITRRNEYEDVYGLYRTTQYEATAYEYGIRARQLKTEVNSTARYARIGTGLLLLTYAYNIIDGMRAPSAGYRLTPSVDPYNIDDEILGFSASLTLQIKL